MDVEEVPEDPIDNLITLTLTYLKTPLRRGDTSLVDLLTPKVELLNTPLLEQMGERLTNVNNILEAEDDGLKYLKLNNFYNFRQAETHATTLDAAIPEMGVDNTDYDIRQKQEKEEISQLEIDNSRKV